MAQARVTMLVRNTAGYAAKLRARTRAQKQRLLAANQQAGELVLERSIALSPVDTAFMQDHIGLEFTREGYNFAVGCKAGDFLGATNPVDGREITTFYPPLVHNGTRLMAGRPWLKTALQQTKPEIRRLYKNAMRVRKSDA